eukprot:355922-Chlamydomonas_euryale.AAC.2
MDVCSDGAAARLRLCGYSYLAAPRSSGRHDCKSGLPILCSHTTGPPNPVVPNHRADAMLHAFAGSTQFATIGPERAGSTMIPARMPLLAVTRRRCNAWPRATGGSDVRSV